MAFKALFLAHAPDADHEKHNNVIDTGRFKVFTVVVKTQSDAIKVSENLYKKEKIHSIILCPGFTHNDVSEIFQALEGKVSVNVSRGDGPSNKISHPLIQREYYDKQ